MTQRATVKRRLKGGRVEIVVRRESACSHNCADCAGCASIIHTPEVTAVAEDAMGAQVGQQVTVESASKGILWIAALLYLIPFAALFVTAVCLQNAGEMLAAGVSCAVFLGVLCGVSVPLERYFRRHKAVTYRVVALEER